MRCKRVYVREIPLRSFGNNACPAQGETDQTRANACSVNVDVHARDQLTECVVFLAQRAPEIVDEQRCQTARSHSTHEFETHTHAMYVSRRLGIASIVSVRSASQTQTALACLILTERCKYADEGTQTVRTTMNTKSSPALGSLPFQTDDIGAYDLSSSNGFATRLGKFLVSSTDLLSLRRTF